MCRHELLLHLLAVLQNLLVVFEVTLITVNNGRVYIAHLTLLPDLLAVLEANDVLVVFAHLALSLQLGHLLSVGMRRLHLPFLA